MVTIYSFLVDRRRCDGVVPRRREPNAVGVDAQFEELARREVEAAQRGSVDLGGLEAEPRDAVGDLLNLQDIERYEAASTTRARLIGSVQPLLSVDEDAGEK